MMQEHAKYEQEVIYGTTYNRYIYINIYRKFEANSSMWGSLTLAPINMEHGLVMPLAAHLQPDKTRGYRPTERYHRYNSMMLENH